MNKMLLSAWQETKLLQHNIYSQALLGKLQSFSNKCLPEIIQKNINNLEQAERGGKLHITSKIEVASVK